MNMNDIRRQNILTLIERRFNGNQTEMARQSGIASTSLNQMLSRGKNEKTRRTITERTARHIERELALEVGYLDKPQPGQKIAEPPAQYTTRLQMVEESLPLLTNEQMDTVFTLINTFVKNKPKSGD